MNIQVIERREVQGESLSVIVTVPSRKVRSIMTIMALAGIPEKPMGRGPGWILGDGQLLISQPWRYRGKIERAVRMLEQKWHPGFRTGLEMKEGKKNV